MQAVSKNSTGCVRLDLNLLKPSRIEFLHDLECPLTVPDGIESSPTWLEYVYQTAHPALRWLPSQRVVKLYKPSPTPCLYVAPFQNMVGRVPLIPSFLAGNSTPTIPHMFSKNKAAGFPSGCADAAALDGRRGSNIYEVNPWLWRFGRGKPRLWGPVDRSDCKEAGCCQRCVA